VDERRAPDIVWVARLAAPPTKHQRPPSRSICARPTRSRRMPRGCRADDRDVRGCSRAASRRCRTAARAMPRPSPHCTPLVSARLERRRVRADAGERNIVAHRATVGRSLHGFILSRLAAAKPKSFRSRCVARRGRGLARRCSICTAAAGRPWRAGAVFLEVDEDNEPARRLYRRPGSARSGGGRATTSKAATRPRPRWCCAAIWSECRDGRPWPGLMIGAERNS
jgi:hypothetical protein